MKVADTPISKDKDVELGVYDVGFDKITGESKMIVWVRKDPVTQKWKSSEDDVCGITVY